MEFQIHDIVEFFGVKGKIIKIQAASLRPLVVEHQSETNRRSYFMLDGRIEEWHKEPTLKFVERIKEVSFTSLIKKSAYIFNGGIIEESEEMKLLLGPFVGKKVEVTVRLL